MTPPDLVRLFVTPLNELGLSYMVTGGIAAIIYGEPRLTRDIDLVVSLSAADVAGLVSAFPEPDFYLAPAEVIVAEIGRSRRGHFNAIHIPTTLKADFYSVGKDPLQEWGMARCRDQDMNGVVIRVAPPEYVILRKLEWYQASGSSRHLDDVRMMLRVSDEEIDRTAIESWAATLRVDNEWRAAHS